MPVASMFEGATKFNKDISSWNTQKVTNMTYMFKVARNFNRAISTSGTQWDTSQVLPWKSIFESTKSFNQHI